MDSVPPVSLILIYKFVGQFSLLYNKNHTSGAASYMWLLIQKVEWRGCITAVVWFDFIVVITTVASVTRLLSGVSHFYHLCSVYYLCVFYPRWICRLWNPIEQNWFTTKNPIRMNLFKAIWNCGQIVQVCCPFPELPFRVLFQNFSRVFFQGSLSEFYREILVGLSFERGKQITFFITD